MKIRVLDLSPFQIWKIPDPPKYSISIAEQNQTVAASSQADQDYQGAGGFQSISQYGKW